MNLKGLIKVKSNSKFTKKVISVLLSGTLIVSSLPMVGVSASSEKPRKEDEPTYNPVFSYPEEEFAFTSDLDKIKDIGKLPSYEEFTEHTGYVNNDLSLSELVEKIGTGTTFDLSKFDVNSCNIVLSNADELDLFSLLVNNKVDNETSAEQDFYANCTISLATDIDYSFAKNKYSYQPIGTIDYPFNGKFNGRQFEIQNVNITESSEDDYSTGAFGIFGVVDTNAVIENFGIVNMNVDLPYSVGANVSWVAGVNNGTIRDIYVNSKTTSRIVVSNATVGGIAAENNGIIQGCYVDGYAEVSSTEGAYSEPQPITTVNNGSVKDCYYILWEDRTVYSCSMEEDDGYDSSVYGWKTTSNYLNYNGTGISIDNLINMDGVIGTKFKKWLPNTNGVDKPFISVSSFVSEVGRGTDFNKEKAEEILSEKVLIIGNKKSYDIYNDWNLFANLVNNTAENETEEEQKFYSTVNINLSYYTSENWGGSYTSYEENIGSQFIPIGTDEYPFNGIFDGHNITISPVIDFSNVSPLFGVIGQTGMVKNLKIDIRTTISDTLDSTNINSILATTNKGIIDSVIVRKVGYIYSWEDNLKPLLDKGYNNLYSIVVNNDGIINRCRSVFGFIDDNRSISHYMSAVKVNNGTVTDLIYRYDNSVGNGIGEASITLDTDYGFSTSYRYDYYAQLTSSLPVLSTPDIEDNKYIIKSPANFMFLLNNVNKQYIDFSGNTYTVNAKLANTIDLKYTVINKEYETEFILDGLMTNTNDVCSYIDIGVDKCYGILNLSFDKHGIFNGNGYDSKGSINNVYFIGGAANFISGSGYSYDTNSVNLYGTRINNVHSSINEVFNNTSSYIEVKMSNYATDSSYSGIVDYSSSVRDTLYLVSNNAEHCISNAEVNISGSRYEIYGIGNNVSNSISNVHINNLNSKVDSGIIYGIGYEVHSSIFNGNIESSCGLTYAVGYNTYYTDFRGTLSGVGYLSDYCNHSILSGTIDGAFNGMSNDSYSEYMLFKGVITIYGYESSVYAIGSGSYAYNIGTIKVIITGDNQRCKVYGMGTDLKNSKMNGKIEVINTNNYSNISDAVNNGYFLEKLPTDILTIYYFGGSYKDCANYSDVYAPDNYYCNLLVYNSNCGDNYGNIYTNGNSILTAVSYNGVSGINYGDIYTDETMCKANHNSYYGVCANMLSNSNTGKTTFKNYGNVSINGYYKNIRYANLIVGGIFRFSGKKSNGDESINYGNIYVKGKQEDIIDSTISHSLWIEGNGVGLNYGDITFEDAKANYGVNIIASMKYNEGNILVNNVDISSLYVYALQMTKSQLLSYKNVTLTNKGNILLNNINNASVKYESIDIYDDSVKANGGTNTLKNTGNIKISNSYNLKDLSVIGVSNGVYTNSGNYSTEYLYNYGTIELDNVSTVNNEIKNYILSVGGVYNDGVDRVLDYGDIILNNVVFNDNNTLFVSSLLLSSKTLNEVESHEDIAISNCKLPNSYISSLAVSTGSDTINDSVSTGSITMNNNIILNSKVAYVSSLVSNYNSMDTIKNSYSIGNIDMDSNNGNFVVSGVYSSGSISNIYNIVHSGNINVSNHNDDINVSGISNNSYSIKNAINTGNINVDIGESSSNINVSAITLKSSYTYSVINWGDIFISGNVIDDDLSSVTSLGKSNNLKIGVNYGNVYVPETLKNTIVSTYDTLYDFSECVSVINYGTFNNAKSRKLSNSDKLKYIVDLSKNKDAVIDSNFTFSNDDNMKPLFVKEPKGVYIYNNDKKDYELIPGAREKGLWIDISSCVLTGGYDHFGVPSEHHSKYENVDKYNKVERKISYNDMFKPDFPFRYLNALYTSYTNVYGDREGYNGSSGLDCTDIDSICGETLNYIKNKFGEVGNGYIVSASDIGSNSTIRILGTPIEDMLRYETAGTTGWYYDKIDTKWGYMSFKDLIENHLKQTDVVSRTEVTSIKLSSENTIKTDSGLNANTLSSSTSLIYFQAPVDGDNDCDYSENIIVSVSDVYTVVNDYTKICGTKIKFNVDIQGTRNHNFYSLGKAIEFDSEEEMQDYIKSKLSDESYDLSDMIVTDEDKIIMSLPKANGTTYGIIGYTVAEDNIHKNLICVKLHSELVNSSAYLSSFYYPTGVENGVLTYTEAVDDTADFNNIVSTEKYKVENNKETISGYGDNVYPIYTMSENMVRSTYGICDDYGNTSNNTTGTVSMGVKLKNIRDVKMIVQAGSSKVTSNISLTTEKISTNGLFYLRDGSKIVSDLFSNALDDSNNLFSKYGTKTITLKGTTSSGYEITLMVINFTKNKSYENYIHSTIFEKNDYTKEDGSTRTDKYLSKITPSNIKNPPVIDWSLLKYAANSKKTITKSLNVSDVHTKGETQYPCVVVSPMNVISEEGYPEIYSYCLNYPIIDSVGVYSVTDNIINKTVNSNLFVNDSTDKLDAYINFDNSKLQFSSGGDTFKIKKLRVLVNGGKDGDTIITPNSTSTSVYGMSIEVVSDDNLNRLHITANDISSIPVGIITVEPVISYAFSYSYRYKSFDIQLDSFSISSTHLSDSRLLNVYFDNTIVTSAISSSSDMLSGDVDIDYIGDIDYTNTADSINHFYIYNSIGNNVKDDIISLKVPLYATLEKYTEGVWSKVFTSSVNNTVYNEVIAYNEGIQALSGKYRVKAQDYNENNIDTKNHITYYDMIITRTTRNKNVYIKFKDSDETTKELYNEIINKYGNMSVVIKNMNGDKTTLQQSKFYVNEESNESTYYKLSQGDYAIDVQVPEGYIAKVRIIGGLGGSSEGYLTDNSIVKGKRLQLPYANEQTINLEITLEREQEDETTNSKWGVETFSSLFTCYVKNNV